MYRPSDLKSLPTELQDLFTGGTICLEAVDNGIKSIPLTGSVDMNWCSFIELILRAAKEYISRAVNDEQAADLLGLHFQTISRLNFSVEDRKIKIRASRIVHGCRSDTHRRNSIFSRNLRVYKLETAIGDSCLNKSPGPDGIHGHMIGHLGLREGRDFWTSSIVPGTRGILIGTGGE
ncbi:hypothetical protein TNCV_256561 [Trichonephila clavipes]|nr:hypothetical protein TNCV_256561 [Trichonephila clavipes]